MRGSESQIVIWHAELFIHAYNYNRILRSPNEYLCLRTESLILPNNECGCVGHKNKLICVSYYFSWQLDIWSKLLVNQGHQDIERSLFNNIEQIYV